MALQKITTREPDESMVEVAIEAVSAVFDWEEYIKEFEEEGASLKEESDEESEEDSDEV